ncbi:MAG: histidinol-phosphatase HisJ family protein [Moorellales bacterium]
MGEGGTALSAGLADYHVHLFGHGEGKLSRDYLEEFVRQAQCQGLEELGLADHDDFLDQVRLLVSGPAREWVSSLPVRVGLEISYRPERSGEIRRLAGAYRFDYLIGSVHDLDGWPFDHPDYIDGYAGRDPDQLYRQYFSLVVELARSGLFDVVGHLDLIKIFGCRCRKPVTELASAALTAVKEAGLVVEVNTAGLFKPVGEIYPGPELLQACYDLDLPITFGSDAHRPEEVGRSFSYAAERARRVGYRRYVQWRERRRLLVPL